MLHMEIVQERLEREYDLNLITTAPTVVYEVLTTDGTVMSLDNPAKLPPVTKIQEIREPIILANILTPPEYVGNVITCARKSAAASPASTTWAARCRSPTSCRWPRWCWISLTG